MVHYHGGPFSDPLAAAVVWRSRHAMVSFARPEQIKLAADVCQSFCLDNGAYSAWKKKVKPNFDRYYSWVECWIHHPGCDFAIIPDAIGGTEDENDELLERWPFERWHGCPVWHMHESLKRLRRLTKEWPRVAIGSSGSYASPGSKAWWDRINSAMRVCCNKSGIPRTRLLQVSGGEVAAGNLKPGRHNVINRSPGHFGLNKSLKARNDLEAVINFIPLFTFG